MDQLTQLLQIFQIIHFIHLFNSWNFWYSADDSAFSSQLLNFRDLTEIDVCLVNFDQIEASNAEMKTLDQSGTQ
jgi:hypothetical protein